VVLPGTIWVRQDAAGLQQVLNPRERGKRISTGLSAARIRTWGATRSASVGVRIRSRPKTDVKVAAQLVRSNNVTRFSEWLTPAA
jgi:hypothetical protein